MDRPQEKYFTIGEMATLFDISKQTLFYYEKNKFFTPDFIDDNGYRYYSMEKYYVFEIFMNLRKLGMPLQKIAQYTEHRNIEALIKVLSDKLHEYSRQITQLEQNKESLRKKIAELKLYRRIHVGRITLEECQEEHLATTLYNINLSTHKDKVLCIAVHNKPFTVGKLFSEFNMGYILPQKTLQEGKYNEFSRLYTRVQNEDTDGSTLVIRPEGLYASVYFNRGLHAKYHQSLKKLLDFIERNKLIICGDVYVVPLLNHWATARRDEYLTKLSIMVRESEDDELNE